MEEELGLLPVCDNSISSRGRYRRGGLSKQVGVLTRKWTSRVSERRVKEIQTVYIDSMMAMLLCRWYMKME